jgi:hypothetical protein
MNATAPPIAGLCTYAQGAMPGHSVERTVQLLRRYLFVESQTMRCLVAHLNGVPEWEVKCGLSLHLWQDAEHCTWLRDRVKEMRTPPLHLDRIPDPALDAFFQELIRSRTTLELLTGVYRVLKPATIAAMQQRYEEIRKRFQAILDQDQALPRAEWWDAFYQQIPRQGER